MQAARGQRAGADDRGERRADTALDTCVRTTLVRTALTHTAFTRTALALAPHTKTIYALLTSALQLLLTFAISFACAF